jgi:ferredoxin
MSKKDGKATLLKGIGKKEVYILTITHEQVERSLAIAEACPVRIIKVQ